MKASPLGEMPIDQFLSEYWQKKPLYIRNALPGVSSPLPGDMLAGLACEEGVESRLIIQHDRENDWELTHGPFNDEIFSTLPESHWTLLVQAVDHWVPEAAGLLERFNFIPRWRIDDLMISYASDGGGIGPHYDNYDVFLVQTSGKKQWEIGGLCDDTATLRENMPVKILNEFNPVETWVLEPGDILYVPPGIAHNGVAIGDDSMTCSVGFRAPSHSEILREYTDYLGDKLTEAVRYEDPDLMAQDNTGELSPQTLDKIQTILRKHCEDKAIISDWFGRYITTPKYQLPDELGLDETEPTFNQQDLVKHFAEGGLLVRNESSRFAFEVRNDDYLLYVDGHCLNTTADSSELIKFLCAEIELSKEEFVNTNNNLNLLLKLLQRGALYLAEP